ncbi:MAG: hypothetical protein JF614_30315, partial [Acidobacteria bacterium]|nr:hypothetical protein [Acidobacteriota bacterium]
MGRLGWPLIAGVLLLVAVVPGRAQSACSLTQLTNTTGSSFFNFFPAFNAAGNRIVFNSSADLVGSNGDGGVEAFLWDASIGFTQITNVN